jgi:hypothetical protein
MLGTKDTAKATACELLMTCEVMIELKRRPPVRRLFVFSGLMIGLG